MQELIADLPLDDRPREKMRRHGAEGLSDAELISLLLGSGTRGKNAIQLARELLREGLASLGSLSADCMAKTSGVGLAKATRIGAAFEIARRLACVENADGARYDDAIVARALIGRYAHESQEHLGAVLLDSRHRVLKQCEIYVGTVSRALVSTRDVVRVALDANAVGVVLFHNHPSGDPAPSPEDHVLTTRLRQAGELLGIALLDHIILGDERTHSFADYGWPP